MEHKDRIYICNDGFVWLILTAEEAKQVWLAHIFPLYRLYDDGSEGEINTPNELVETIDKGYRIGIEVGFIPSKYNIGNSVITYKDIDEGDLVKCNQCDKVMLLPYAADQCPECCGDGTLVYFNDEQEYSIRKLEDEFFNISSPVKALKPEDYLSPDTLALEFPDYYRELHNRVNPD